MIGERNEESLNNTINYNLFGEPSDIIEENLESAAIAFKELKDKNLNIINEDLVRSILESDNPYNENFLKPYNL